MRLRKLLPYFAALKDVTMRVAKKKEFDVDFDGLLNLAESEIAGTVTEKKPVSDKGKTLDNMLKVAKSATNWEKGLTAGQYYGSLISDDEMLSVNIQKCGCDGSEHYELRLWRLLDNAKEIKYCGNSRKIRKFYSTIDKVL